MLERMTKLISLLQEAKTWTYVKDKPLSDILESSGINKREMPAIVDALRTVGLMEVSGARSGMRYKFGEKSLYQSSESLARKLIEELNSKKITIRFTELKSRQTKFKPKVYTVGDRVCYLYDSNITEGFIVSVACESVNGFIIHEKNSVKFDFDEINYRVVNLQGEINSVSQVYPNIDILLESMKRKYELYLKSEKS